MNAYSQRILTILQGLRPAAGEAAAERHANHPQPEPTLRQEPRPMRHADASSRSARSGWRRFAALLVLCMALTACNQTKQNVQTTPVLNPPPVEDLEPSIAENPGSIYNPGHSEFLFEDNRARRVGDVVLINVVENTTSTLETETTSERQSTTNLQVQAAFGQQTVGLGTLMGLAPYALDGETGADPILQFNTQNEFEGEGETSREAQISATIGARVVKVLPGGLLQIQGSREVRVNDEIQMLLVQGLVRPRDIGPDNSILSTQLADARVEYYGRGVLTDRQSPGWGARVIDNIWPF